MTSQTQTTEHGRAGTLCGCFKTSTTQEKHAMPCQFNFLLEETTSWSAAIRFPTFLEDPRIEHELTTWIESVISQAHNQLWLWRDVSSPKTYVIACIKQTCILANHVSKHLIVLKKRNMTKSLTGRYVLSGKFLLDNWTLWMLPDRQWAWTSTALTAPPSWPALINKGILEERLQEHWPHLIHEICLPKRSFLYVLQACSGRQPQAARG